MSSLRHVNPNCKDAQTCNPHGETGKVTYRNSLREKIAEIMFTEKYPESKWATVDFWRINKIMRTLRSEIRGMERPAHVNFSYPYNQVLEDVLARLK